MMLNTTSLPSRRGHVAGRFLAILLTLGLSLGLWVQSAPRAMAQDTGSVLLGEAIQAINAEDYETARTKLEELTTDYRASLAVAEGYAKLGYVYLLLNDFEKARESLQQAIDWPNASESIVQLSMNLLPQAISAQAGAVEDDPDKKKQLYQEAITAFDAFLQTYPEAGAATEGAYYGKGLAQYFREEYTAAIESLQQAVNLYPQSESLGENKYLLAVAKSSRAVQLYQEDDELNREEYIGLQKEALGLLDQVKEMTGAQRNEAVINDAWFQSGEILMNLAAVSPDEAEKTDYRNRAIKAYQQVRPRDAMITALQEQVRQVIARIRDSIRARNAAQQEQLEAIRDRTMLKLVQLRNKPPQTIDAKLGMARVYFQQERYDAARVLLRFLSEFELSEQQSKNLLYYLALSYANQQKIESALANFETFQQQFQGDPMAENLPLVMGNLFLNEDPPNPERAMEFYQLYFENYPRGELLAAAWVSYAKALEMLGRFEEAEKAYQKAAEAQPEPQIAMNITLGEGTAQLNRGEFDGAIAKFDQVLEQYGNLPGAEEALYRKGSAIIQKGQPGEAIPVLQKFRTENPDHGLLPFALFDLGNAMSQAATTQDPVNQELAGEALQILRQIPVDYPDTQVGPYSYLLIAQIQAQLGNVEEMRAAYQDYLTQYPEDPQVYFAYNALTNLLLQQGKNQEAAVLWTEFVNNYPEHENADVALITVAMLWQQSGNALGHYNGLDSGKQAEWQENMRLALDNAEKLVNRYPESQWVTKALSLIRNVRTQMVQVRLMEREEVASYLEELANSLSATPSAMKKAMFTLAGFIYPTEPERAMEIMQAHYQPDLKLAPEDLDLYGLELIEAGEVDKAEQIFQKILDENPPIEGAAPNQWPPDLSNARAIGLFGLGSVATARGDVDKAGMYYTELKDTFPWNPKIGQSRYGIALSLYRDGQYNDALNEVVTLIRDQSKAITSELRAKAHLLGGKILLKRDQPENPSEKIESDAEIARQYVQKVPVAYGSNSFAVAEAHWLLAKIYDILAAKESNPEQKAKYEQLRQENLNKLETFPDSPFYGKPISDPLPDK